MDDAVDATARLEPPAAPRLPALVLPFANIGGDPEQEYFIDGVTESLTTDLSRIRGAFVIGRSTAFTYKGKAADVRQIGRELNVRYVLEGSVQRGGKCLRVNVQLLDAETASHIWAERFDKPIADLFDMQDEIVSRLANGLGQELARAEARRAERSANPNSMDHYFLGLGADAIRAIPPPFSTRRVFTMTAHSNSTRTTSTRWLVAHGSIWLCVMSWLSDDRRDRLFSAEAYVAKALKLRPDSRSRSLRVGGVANVRQSRRARHRRVRARAGDRPEFRLPPTDYIGMAKVFSGCNEETEAHILEALRISPRDERAWALDGYRRDQPSSTWVATRKRSHG